MISISTSLDSSSQASQQSGANGSRLIVTAADLISIDSIRISGLSLIHNDLLGHSSSRILEPSFFLQREYRARLGFRQWY